MYNNDIMLACERIFKMALVLNDSEKFTCFVNFSGHIDGLTVCVHDGGWKRENSGYHIGGISGVDLSQKWSDAKDTIKKLNYIYDELVKLHQNGVLGGRDE